ncbi:glycosyltransferase family 39 protein [Brevibacillus dissolubilis]|uniref:glycosyltransferase family 39 protein n=1 Tax=Brevibacillus dissolubilis TaxID=1844116 RepID=UPI001115AEE4|nr:glycosyltransferase family 39 protein [Brevibacillus dissolubilis]
MSDGDENKHRGKQAGRLHRGLSVLALAFLVLLHLAVSLSYSGGYAESWDAVDFVLALDRYDIFEMQPHFPGYPLFILLGHLFLSLTGEPVRALTWVSAVCGSLSLVPFYLLARRMLGSGIRVWLAVMLFAVSPLLTLTSVQPMSEAMGLFLVLTMTAWLARAVDADEKKMLGIGIVGALLFAMVLGVRTSYFPVGVLLLFPLLTFYAVRRQLAGLVLQTFIVGAVFLCGLLAWLLPTASTEGGLLPYWQLGQAFTVGHFTEWGGTSLSSEQGMWDRMWAWSFERMLLNGLLGVDLNGPAAPLSTLMLWFIGGLMVEAVWLGGRGVLGAWRRSHKRGAGRLIDWFQKNPRIWFGLLAVVPYALWMFFGQNSEKARHILPLLPWVFLLMAYGWGELYRKVRLAFAQRGLARTSSAFRTVQVLSASIGLVIFASLADRQLSVLLAHMAPPPALQMIQYTQKHYPAGGAYIYTWEEQRLFDYYAPDYVSERVRSYSYFVKSILLQSATTSQFLMTNAVLDGFGPDHPLRQQVREVARFAQDPFVYPTYHTVILYELPREAVERLQRDAEALTPTLDSAPDASGSFATSSVTTVP